MNEVILHGFLAEKYGKEFRLNIRTAAEAVRCLAANFKGFARDIRTGQWLVFRELRDSTFALDVDTINLGMDGSRIHIMPSVAGLGSDAGPVKVILGVALIGAALLIPGMQAVAIGAFIKGGIAITYGAIALTSGLALTLGGLAMLISPGVSNAQDGKIDSSFLINNPGISPQGKAMPLVFGEWMATPLPVAAQLVRNQLMVGSGNYDFSSDAAAAGLYNANSEVLA